MAARNPIFCVVLKDGEHWQVEAEWPDGTIEHVYKFKAGYEALNWVKSQSAAWKYKNGKNRSVSSTADVDFIEEQPIRSHAVGNVTVRDFAESVKLSL